MKPYNLYQLLHVNLQCAYTRHHDFGPKRIKYLVLLSIWEHITTITYLPYSCSMYFAIVLSCMLVVPS